MTCLQGGLEFATVPCLSGCSIPAPIVVSVDGGLQLECYIGAVGGIVQLRSLLDSRGTQRVSTHCSATLAGINEHTKVLKDASNPTHVYLATSSVADSRQQHVQCIAGISVHLLSCDSGWMVHPTVLDNSLHLGPATSDVGRQDDANVTRVVAGMAAYATSKHVSLLPQQPRSVGYLLR